MKIKLNKILLGLAVVFLSVGIVYMIFMPNVLEKRVVTEKAKQAYIEWKEKYIEKTNNSTSRVVNPQDNNITVSEGIGYGMLFSVALEDKETFDALLEYVKKHKDKYGLMNWKIDSQGRVIGNGSASDADQDIAYALLLASKKWDKKMYKDEAVAMINAILKHEVNSDYLLLPGDQWGDDAQYNPSYFCPSYYNEFALASENNAWKTVLSANMKFMYEISNKNTGLLPDWINYDKTSIKNKSHFGYDAVRVPIRLIQYYKKNKDNYVNEILSREYSFFSKIGTSDLKAGYTTDGQPQVSYINATYLSSFAAISHFKPYSSFNLDTVNSVNNIRADDYYGSSVKVWTLLIISDQLGN